MKIQQRSPIKINLDSLRTHHTRGESDTWIANSLGVSQTGITRARQKLGLKPNFLCAANKNNKDPQEIYADYIKRSRRFKKQNKDILDQKQKEYRSTPEHKKKHRDYERARRAREKEKRLQHGNN